MHAVRNASGLIVALLVALMALAGCVLTTNLADLTGGEHADVDASVLYTIGGTVQGLGGATITLGVNSRETLSVASDGPFTFQHRVPPGDAYIVSVVRISDKRTCTVKNGEGFASTNVIDVTVECPSSNTRLSNLSLSAAPLSPSFLPDVLDYTAQFSLDVFALDAPVTITATVESPRATLTIDDAPATSGKPFTLQGLHAGANTISVAVRAEGGATIGTYTVVLTERTQEAYVKASNTGGIDFFGTSVAVSLDGNTLAVGALNESSRATGIDGDQNDYSAAGAGAVYVFRRSGSTWQQEAYVKASNSRSGLAFGGSVALSSDGNTLAVGAKGEQGGGVGVDGNEHDQSMPGAGAVYVFRRAGSTWTQEAYVKAWGPSPGSSFGRCVSLSSDGSTLGVTAVREASAATGINGDHDDRSAAAAGAAYVFTRAGKTWTQEVYLKASNTRPEAAFGSALALSGDATVLAVGSWGESSGATGIDGNQGDTSAPNAGAVYVFTHLGPAWKQEAYVKASSARANTTFGVSVALSTNGATLVVGAPGDSSGGAGVDANPNDTSAMSAGAAYVFRRTGASWTKQAYLKATVPRIRSTFGTAVALSGDGTRLAVGAAGDSTAAKGVNGTSSDTADNSGASYAFVLAAPATTWAQTAFIKASNVRAHAAFGLAVALSADGHTLAVGSDYESSAARGIDGDQSDTSLAGAGAAYVFR